MMTPLHFSSVYCSFSDSMEKPAAVEPPDLPPLEVHDAAPPSVNDQVRVDFGRDGKHGIPYPDNPSPHLPHEIPPTNSYKYKIVFFLEFINI